jgi:tyrosyl-tRNA synthetase
VYRGQVLAKSLADWCRCGVQADICQLGMDQRKVNMLAREYCNDIKRKLKPVILSHRMMPGLLEVRRLHAAATAAAVARSRPLDLSREPTLDVHLV